MKKNTWYAKPNLVVEPLFDRWYAWSHLISPATSAMNVVNRHLKIMDSYIQNPHIHAAAAKNPKMRGGPFVDLPVSRVEEVKALRAATVAEKDYHLRFAAAIVELNQLLKTAARGFSMDTLYSKVPEILRGKVELVYDLNNNPSFRFFEPLLYKNECYHEASQSLALWITNNDERPFVLSTPRLDEPNVIHVEVPFKHPGIDMLSRMRRIPGDIEEIAQAFNIREEDRALFNTFFTQEPPVAYNRYEGDKIRMRYFGHACILVETKEVSILVDPVISYHGYSTDVTRYSEAHLPDKIDYVIITHNHQDHILFETLLSLRNRIGHIVVPRSGNGSMQDPGLKLMFNAIGFNNVLEIGEFESVGSGICQITGIPFIGEHSDLDIRSKLCHHVRIGQYTLMFAADSCNVEAKLYEEVFKVTGTVDSLFLGMECDGAPLSWLYGPLLSEDMPRDMDNSRRLAGSNYERGKAMVDVFKPKELYVYAMGMEPWLEFISSIKYTDESNPIVQSNKLINECRQNNIISERLYGEKELFYEIEAMAEL
ncbi:MBL fold metallo-hydrolase [Chitinophaga sp. Cy-1792]|uniref:MBL fold metallo-hydrolase n=1 Tax=Chitinophaga sp. Cy-1792 TaxID=2608339 RepID=UPI00142473BB|nr:MBL fold metallo-hydrolase [Chitinophaga sp. Cy-1792]NIG56803.1 MBL fold metallo-hydrolase [Chitinophaga sp. Cy-1792]